ncbi:MAG: class C sortase [Oscillospiraceae bacterium]|nr:class C sortase [Oscillospiraceae bacterium]
MKKKSHLTTIILVLVLVFGLSLLLYPTISDQWNKRRSSQAIAVYEQALLDSGEDVRTQMLQDAIDYNRSIAPYGIRWKLDDAQRARYNDTLDPLHNGMFGYIEIERINCRLPVYHGTSEPVLQTGIGHIEGSSLPVGGESSHCLLSGHTGLPSARLFTDLSELTVGDRFRLCMLDAELTYEIDRINIVLPYELDLLRIEQGEDLCTLITCTPYGINSHRLLVRGHRVENDAQSAVVRVSGDALPIDPLIVALVTAVPVLLLTFTILLILDRRKRRSAALGKPAVNTATDDQPVVPTDSPKGGEP